MSEKRTKLFFCVFAIGHFHPSITYLTTEISAQVCYIIIYYVGLVKMVIALKKKIICVCFFCATSLIQANFTSFQNLQSFINMDRGSQSHKTVVNQLKSVKILKSFTDLIGHFQKQVSVILFLSPERQEKVVGKVQFLLSTQKSIKSNS